MKSINKILSLILIVSAFFVIVSPSAFAYQGIGTTSTPTNIVPSVYGGGTGATVTSTPTVTNDGVAVINNPLPGSPLDIFHAIINRIVAVFFFVVGVALIGLIIYGGVLYIVDAGNEESAKKAQKVITSAIIGLVIIALTGVIIKFVEAILGVSLGL